MNLLVIHPSPHLSLLLEPGVVAKCEKELASVSFAPVHPGASVSTEENKAILARLQVVNCASEAFGHYQALDMKEGTNFIEGLFIPVNGVQGSSRCILGI